VARYDVPFGGGRLQFTLPDACARNVTRERAAPSPKADGDQKRLEEDIAQAASVLVVVNDAYRPTPTAALLDPFKRALARCGEVRFVVATGMHPPPEASEVEALLGEFARDYPVAVHGDSTECTCYGVLSDGTPLELSILLEWPERILLVGSVEPHFFAGFTGGPKQLLPGLASRACTEANHRHATHRGCRALQVEGNPVALAIRETGELFADRLLSIQAVQGPKGWETFWGGEPQTFNRAAARARAVAEVRWEEPLDGLVAVIGPPLDRNLYQLQKGFENHLAAVKDGGWVLLVSACADGVGNDFFGRLAQAYPNWKKLPAWESQSYSLGLHKLYRTAAARGHYELFLHSQLPREVVKSVYLEPVDNLQSWLDRRTQGAGAIGVVEQADRLVSTLRKSHSLVS
jgi:nickel-dependent lactate racemase